MTIKILLIAMAPAIALGLGVYLTDRYDREPGKLLFKAFMLGCLTVLPVILIESFLSMFNIFKLNILKAAYTAFIVAGFSEEYMKRKTIYRYFYNHKEFNEKLDGIVYSVFVSLGFATVENIMYLFNYSNMPDIGLYRGIFSVPAHGLFAITMGYYISLVKYCDDPHKIKTYKWRSLWIPVFLHGFFDFILMSGNNLLMLLFIPFIIYLWISNLRLLNKYYKESKIQYKNKHIDYDDGD